jgi:hypothetical protein
VRKGKDEEEEEEEVVVVGAHVESVEGVTVFLFQVPLKPTLPHGRAGTGSKHPIVNE